VNLVLTKNNSSESMDEFYVVNALQCWRLNNLELMFFELVSRHWKASLRLSERSKACKVLPGINGYNWLLFAVTLPSPLL